MGTERRLTTELKTFWTKGSTSAAVFHPVTPPIPTRGIVKARPTFIGFQTDTGDVEVSVAYQVSNEDQEDDWDDDTPTELSGSYVSSTGITYTSSYTDRARSRRVGSTAAAGEIQGSSIGLGSGVADG